MADNMADKMGTADFLANLEGVLADYAGMKYLLESLLHRTELAFNASTLPPHTGRERPSSCADS